MVLRRDVGRLGRMHFDVNVATSIFGAGLVIILLHIFIPSIRSELAFGAAIFAGSVAIYGAYYARATLLSRLEADRLKRTFEILDRLNSPDLAGARRSLNAKIDHRNLAPAELFKQVTGDLALYTEVTLLLGLYEDMAIAIQAGYADEDVLFKGLAWPVHWAWESLGGFTHELRKARDRPTIYLQFQELAAAWEAKTALSSPGRLLSHTFEHKTTPQLK